MKFIGGPLHGKPVPDFVAEFELVIVDHHNYNDDGSVTISRYVRTPVFIAPDLPLVNFYLMQGCDQEELLVLIPSVVK